MGLRDILLGRHEVKGPAPDRLFAISTAYVTLQAEHQIDPVGSAAIVFQALATSEFEATLRDMEDVVRATGGDSATSVSTEDDKCSLSSQATRRMMESYKDSHNSLPSVCWSS